MAIKWFENDVSYNSSPEFLRSVGIEELSRTETNVQIKVHLKLKLKSSSSSAFYGYPIHWKVNNGKAMQIKDSGRWYGGMSYKSYATTLNIPVEAVGGTTRVNVYVYASSGGTMNFRKDYDFEYSSYNQKPTFTERTLSLYNGEQLIVSGDTQPENSIIIPENVEFLTLKWNSATDVDNNFQYYEVWHQLNDSLFTRLGTTTELEYKHNIGTGSTTQGNTHDYFVRAVDTFGSYDQIEVSQIKKNQLTGAYFEAVEGFYYATEEVNYRHTLGQNTYTGSKWFSYELSSPIKIYNPKLDTGKILIVGDEYTSSDTTYIKRSELLSYVSESEYKGSLTLSLITRNSYNSSSTTSIEVPIDMQAPPNPPNSIVVSEKMDLGIGSYIIPDKQKFRLTWEGASDPLGSDLTFDVYYKLEDNEYTLITSDTPHNSILVTLPAVKKATNTQFKVVVKNKAGKTAFKESEIEVMHYYDKPTITLVDPVRSSESFSITVVTTLNSSIPEVQLGSQDFTGFSNEVQPFTGLRTTITDEGLTETSSYTLYIKSSDNTNIGTVFTSYSVGQAIPMLSIREKGVGIGKVNDTGHYALTVAGNVEIDESIRVAKTINVDRVEMNNINGANAVFQNTTTNNVISEVVDTKTLKANIISVKDAEKLILNNSTDVNGMFTVSRGGYTTKMNGFEIHFNDKIAFAYSGADTDRLFINYNNQFTGGTTIWGQTAYTVEDMISTLPFKCEPIELMSEENIFNTLSVYDDSIDKKVIYQSTINEFLYKALQEVVKKLEEIKK